MKKYNGIIIDLEHKKQIAAAIDDAQRLARTRKTDAQDIIDACESIEHRLGISKKALDGCTARVDVHAQNFPNAYQGITESTQFTVAFTGGKWRLETVLRADVKRSGHRFSITLTDAAKAAVIERMIEF